MSQTGQGLAGRTVDGRIAPDFLQGGGEMGALIRAHDWKKTSLGAPESWPQSLRTVLRLLLNTGHPMYIFWGPQHLCFYNDAYRQSIGPERHPGSLGLPGRQVWEEIWEIIGPQIDQVLSGGGATWHVNALVPITRNGRREDVYWTYSYGPIDDAAAPNGVSGVLVVCTETTATVLAEKRRSIEIQQQTRLFEQAPGFIIVMRGPEHRVEFVNDVHKAVFGSDGWSGKPIREAFPSIADQGFFELLDRVYATGETYQAQAAKVRYRRTPAAPEETRYLTFIYAPLVGDEGRVSGIFCEGFDVTEGFLASATLVDSEARSERQRRLYEAILSNTPDLAYVFNLEHRFIYANEGLLKMWGRSWDEAIGKNCLELGYEPWHAQMHDREIEQVVATRQPVRGEVPFAGTFGRRIYDYILVPVLNDRGQVEAVAGTTRDVTERQEIEQKLRLLADELAETDRRKTEFLAVLAHELRNPLAPIRNAVEIIQNADGDRERVGAAVEIMQRQLAQMVRLVDDLIDISRISRGSISLQREPLELGAIIRQAVETCRPMIERAQQTLATDVPEQRITLMGDPVRLTQVISNLLNNASKYSRPGSPIRLCVSCDSHEAAVSVKDQGIGIPADMLPDIFGMFTQVNSSSEQSRSGLGIGLALVKTLVEMHGGSVQARSGGLGQGSEFIVRLPRVEPDTVSAVVEKLPASAISGRRILVVDDNQDTARSMAQILQFMGNETRTVFDGLAAVEAAAQFAPELVLLDIGLPGIDGYEACRRILQQAVQKPAVIAITGWGDPEDRRQSAAAGFSAHLVKPVDYTTLSEAINACRPVSGVPASSTSPSDSSNAPASSAATGQ